MAGSKSGGRVLVAGSANVDFVVRAPHIPAPGETVLGDDLMIVPGGKGANQAVACARAGGAHTTMLAALGNDGSGAMLEDSLRSAGVALHLVRTQRPTGAALITVSHDAENAITVAPGANQELQEGHLPDLAGIDWLVLQLETPMATVTSYARAAHAAGVKVLLNAAPAQELPAALLAAVDVLVVNEAELTAIAGSQSSIVERLRATGVRCAVATLGARGCCALNEGRVVLQPAFVVEPIDTTAAGDTFAGVIAAALARGLGFPEALRTAAAAAALTTTCRGAQSSIPEAAAVAQLLADGTVRDADDLIRHCSVNVPVV